MSKPTPTPEAERQAVRDNIAAALKSGEIDMEQAARALAALDAQWVETGGQL